MIARRLVAALVGTCVIVPSLFPKGGGSSSSPPPVTQTAPRPLPAPSAAPAKPGIVLPLSPRSAAAAKPIDDAIAAAASAAEAATESMKPQVRVLPLPARPDGETETGRNGVQEKRSDYDWINVRAVGGRFWMIGEKVFLVSAPGDPGTWPVQQRTRDMDLGYADVFPLNGSTYLLGANWIAEITEEGSEMLRMVHLVPNEQVAINLMKFFSTGGPGKRADLPAAFTRADVWRDNVWIRNMDDWTWKFGKYLSPVGREGKPVRVGHEEALFTFARDREGKGSVTVTRDGRKTETHAVNFVPDEGAVAAGRGRLVRTNGAGFSTSSDGLVWSAPGMILPERNIARKDREGKTASAAVRGSWSKVAHADGIFLAVGADFREGATYGSYDPPDVPVFAYSADGVRWQTALLPLKAVAGPSWGIAGQGGKFIVTPRKRSIELAEITFPRSSGASPEAAKPADELRTEIEQALERGDSKTAVARLAQLRIDGPGADTMRLEAMVRARAGDLDGAWQILSDLERQDESNVVDAGLRASLLQAAGRGGDARGYATWFLSQTPWGDPGQRGATRENIQRFTLLVVAGRVDEAIRFGEMEARRETGNAEWRLMLGMAHLQKGDVASGRRWINEAAELGDPRAKQLLTRLPPQ